ncbi:polysaccharide deacetylase family protein [Singulisphaera acidiphila]|uniref:Putative xylanase/chitin deacetylase n=1 Tax=Singulisphaera acidiphila (strain ATCC BAA-1392 / DSM 18658 / VKM B-2454 / MOB10) TaxID=886293 RepID=L0D6L6_SINAD|nr:polysaccharide deacetylase family protein [Singulisphaera acidiphila]AGA24473.1 putative xylanase/chitin deacetylase [Singulisphaera acidiphila DSM 18658]
MLIQNKREILARGFDQIGLTRLLERTARRPSVLVATFHRIGNPAAGAFYDGVYSASPEAFHAQVRHLRDRFQLVTLEALAAMAGAEFAVDRPTALITFDDGYRDNFDVAFPILQELNAPATFFIPTGYFSRPQVPWWDHAAHVLKRTGKSRITLDWPEPLDLDLEQTARGTAIAAVVRLYLDGKVKADDEARFRAHLEERAEVVVDDSALGRALFMTWDQVRRLAGSGMSIGSHAHDHRALASLAEPDQRHELVESKRILEQEVGREIQGVAYPFGWAGTYDEQTQRLAQEAGYRLAFSSAEGVNRPGAADPFALRRLNVGYHDSAPLFRARTALQTAFGASFL